MEMVANQDVQTRFDDFLDQVPGGEKLIIPRDGEPVVLLIPYVSDDNFADATSAIEELRRFRREYTTRLGGGLTIRELIEEGRM